MTDETDSVIRRHSKHIIDAAKDALTGHRISIAGDASDAIASIAECQVAIDGLRGKTVTVDFPRLPGETRDEHRARFERWRRKLLDGTLRMPQSYIRHPHVTAKGFNALTVAKAYGLPAGDGAGVTIGIIELGGALSTADLKAAGVDPSKVTQINVAGGKPKSDGPNGADGEVALDLQVALQVASAASVRIYWCPNTDSGFLAGINQAASECDIISISWGGAESEWDPSSVKQFSAAFAAARAKGVTVFAAAGDAGSKDGTKADAVDFPASDPNVIGCGGTRLVLNSDGSRKSEVVWNDNPTNDATGGGVSKLFPGRTVPDVAGNADPVTGYTVVVDGQTGVIGGTSAVAPLYAAMTAVVRARRGSGFDFLNEVTTHPTICVDVVSGSNGTYRAGPGRDDCTGLGVVNFGLLDALLTSGGTVPPSQPPVTTPPVTTPPVTTASKDRAFIENISAQLTTYLKTAS